MPVQLILPQNKLDFPNRNGGFDASHPAAFGMAPNKGFSAIFQPSGSYYNALTGAIFTKGSSSYPTNSMRLGIGPAGLSTNNTFWTSISGQATATPTGITCASIVEFATTGDGSFCPTLSVSAGTLVNQFGMNGSSKNVYIYNNGAVVSTFTLNLSTPYFIAASLKSASTVNIVATNLRTGQIFSTVSSTANALSSMSATPRLSTDQAASHFLNGYLATAMYCPNYFGMATMLAWAADPWSFWYPRKQPIVFKVPGTTTAVSVTEAASATDTDTVLHTIKTALTEAASAADTDSAKVTYKTTVSEAANATDADTVKATYTTSLSESGTATDTVGAAGASASKKVVGWFAEWDRKRPIPLELLQDILKEQGSPWAEEISELYKDAQEKEPGSKKQAAVLKKVIRKLPEYVLEPIDWGPIVLSLQAALTTSRSAQAIKNANAALMELQRQHREIEEDEEESIMLLLH